MSHLRSTLTATSVAVAAALTLAAPAAALSGTTAVSIDDVGQPGSTTLDTVWAYPDQGGYYGDGLDRSVQIYRGGVSISGPPHATAQVPGLRAGDELVVRDGWWPSSPEIGRVVYGANDYFEQPLCAGRRLYDATRTAAGSTVDAWSYAGGLYPEYPSYPEYPIVYPEYPEGVEPPGAEYPNFPGSGWLPADVQDLGGTALRVDTRRRLTTATTVTLTESYVSSELGVRVFRTQKPVSCPPEPDPQPEQPTPEQPVVTPGPPRMDPPPQPTLPTPPAVDQPVVKLGALSAAKLRKLGRSGLLKKGIPLSITLDRPAKLRAVATLLAGKKRTKVASKSGDLPKGTTSLRFKPTSAGKRALRKAPRKAKLRIDVKLTGTGGTTGQTVIVTLPRK